MNYFILPGLPKVENGYNGRKIVQKVCKYFGVEEKDMKTLSRKRELVYCRHMCSYFLKLNTRLSLSDIAGLLRDGKQKMDHTTIIHAVGHIKDLELCYDDVKSQIKEIEQSLRN